MDRDIVHTVDLAADYTYGLVAVRRATAAVAGAAPYDDDACSPFLLNRCNIYSEAENFKKKQTNEKKQKKNTKL